jgi:hypothetical protein
MKIPAAEVRSVFRRRSLWLTVLAAAVTGLVAGVAGGSADAAPGSDLSPQDHEGISLFTPANGSTYTTADTIQFRWHTTWSHGNPSTLHFFIGTGGSADNVVHEHYTCPGSTSPSCPTTVGYRNFAPGTYTWGVDHEFPGFSTKHSDRWTFTVRPPPPPLPAPRRPSAPLSPPRPSTGGTRGVVVIGNTLSYRGGPLAEIIDVVRVGRFYVVTQGYGRLLIGRRCQRLDRRSARCSAAGVATFYANMGGGDDSVAAMIPIPSTLAGGAGLDRLEGGSAGDLLNGGPAEDTVDGAGGRDLIVGEGTDVLRGGAGADEIVAQTDLSAMVDGGDGNDTIVGHGGDNVLAGGAGDDYVDGSGGSDKLLGGAGLDTLIGGDGADALSGSRPDEISAGAADQEDLYYCGPGPDNIDPSDQTFRADGLTCERESWIGGVGGGVTALVSWRLHRPRATRPYVEVKVQTRSTLDTFKLELTFLTAGRRVIGRATAEVRGRQWVALRQVNVPASTRRVAAVVVPQ